MSLTSYDLADIKQLMEATIRAAMNEQNSQLDRRFDAIDRRLDEQDKKLETILDAVGNELNEHDKKLQDHEVRITHLERHPA